MDKIFADWLQAELDRRDWSQSDLANKAGINRQVINSYLLHKRKKPDEEILSAIAHALNLPPEEVFRKAGILDDPHTPRSAFEEIIHYRISQLTDKQLDEVMEFLSYIMHRDSNAPTRLIPK